MTLPAWLRAPAWAVVGAAAALAYLLGRGDGTMAERERQAEQQARAVLAATRIYEARVATERAAEAAAHADAVHWRTIAAADEVRTVGLSQRADSLARIAAGLEAAQTASGQPSPCAPAFDALRACQAVTASLRLTLGDLQRAAVADSAALGHADARADTAEARAATVTRTLQTLLAAKTCRLLALLPCPSRRVAFAGGVLAGGASVYALIRLLR